MTAVRSGLASRLPALPRALVGAVLGVGTIVLCSKLVGFARDLVMASRFGTGEVVVGFFACAAWQGLAVFAVTEAATVEQTRATVTGDVHRVRQLWQLTLGLGLVLGLSQAALAPQIAHLLVQDAALHAEVRVALVWTAPGSTALCVLGACIGVLNGRRRFLTAASLTIAWSAVALIGLIAASSPRLAVYGAWSAALVLVATTGFLLLYPWRGEARPGTTGLSRPLGAIALVSVAAVLNQMSFPIERYAASGLSGDAAASVGYAYKLVAVPVGLAMSGVVAWAIPGFLAALGDGIGPFRRLVARICLLSASAAAVAAIAMVIAADRLVELAFGRGAFDGSAVALTADALQGYAVGLPFLVLYIIGVKAAQTLGRLGAAVLASALGISVMFTTVWGLVEQYGIFGATLASTLGNAGAASALLVWVLRARPAAAEFPTQPDR